MEQGNDIKESIGTRWLTFYTYAFLPFRVLAGFVPVLAQYDKLREKGYSVSITFPDLAPAIIFGIFIVVVIYGLHKRFMWGWICNWIFLGTTTLGSPLSMTKGIGPYIVAVAIWILIFFVPNYFYFKRRKILFT